MRPIDEIRHENLLALIALKGGQRQFADAAGIKNPAQVSQWVNRSKNATTGKPRVMSGATARAIEIALGLADGWMDASHDPDAISTALVQVAEPETVPGYVRVEQIDATAGMGGAVINDDHPEIIRSVEYREAYIRALIGFVPPPGRLKLVTGAGDSMRPVIEPGEVMLMDSGVTTFQADGIYWIALGDRDDGHQIKMLQERGDGLWVISANPNYPPFPFPENGRIGGRLYIRHKIERFN